MGTFKVDIAFGGDSFVIIDAKKLGFSLIKNEAADLVKLGEKITTLANEQIGFKHPKIKIGTIYPFVNSHFQFTKMKKDILKEKIRLL